MQSATPIFTLLLFLFECITYAAEITCKAEPAMAGSTANLTCFFNMDVGASRRPFNVRRVSDTADILDNTVLDCFWRESKPFCHTVKHGYEFDFTVTDQLTISIPNVTLSHQGKYVCQVVPSHPKDLHECLLVVIDAVVPENVTSSPYLNATTKLDIYNKTERIHEAETTTRAETASPKNASSFSISSAVTYSVDTEIPVLEISTLSHSAAGNNGTRNDLSAPGLKERSSNLSTALGVTIPIILILAASSVVVYFIWKRKKFCFRKKKRSFIVHIRKDDTLEKNHRIGLCRNAGHANNEKDEPDTVERDSYDLDDIEEVLQQSDEGGSQHETGNGSVPYVWTQFRKYSRSVSEGDSSGVKYDSGSPTEEPEPNESGSLMKSVLDELDLNSYNSSKNNLSRKNSTRTWPRGFDTQKMLEPTTEL